MAIIEVIGFLVLYVVLNALLAQFKKGVWVLPIYVLIVTIWYHPVIDHFTMLILIFVFVTAALAEWRTKGLSNESFQETLSKKETESKFEDISCSLAELREKLRGLDFTPYSVSVGLNCSKKTLWELFQKVGFCDKEGWINGVKFGQATRGFELSRGIHLQVLSSDEYGNPELIYRTDGKTPCFQSGLGELRRMIGEVSFGDAPNGISPYWSEALRAITGPAHPILCFGGLIRECRDTYQIAIEVDEDWWKNISNKPEVEWQIVRKGDEHGPYVSVYLVLARIPREAIHGEAADMWTTEPTREYKTRLEELGWTLRERGWLQHKFVDIHRHHLDGNSSVGSEFDWDSTEASETNQMPPSLSKKHTDEASRSSVQIPVLTPPVPPAVEPSSVQCSKCGAQHPSDYSSCTTCGASLNPAG
jgi:hypothetical protein